MEYTTDLGDGRVRAPKNLIQRLGAISLEHGGKTLAAGRGQEWQPAVPGNCSQAAEPCNVYHGVVHMLIIGTAV